MHKPRPTPHDGKISQGLGLLITLAWLAVHLGCIFGPPVTAWPPLALAAVLLVQAWLSTGLFIIAHDCMHGAFAPGQRARNRMAGRAALMLYAGLDYDRMAPAHFAHHRMVGTDQDPDFNAAAPNSPLRWFLHFFGNYYTHIQLVRITAAACIYMALGASLINFAVFWAVPAIMALGQLFFFGTFLPHRHSGQPFADQHRARSVGAGGLVSLISCFHFGGYHHEHHLFPQTPWWRLPDARKKHPV
ncbi:fatty acid desaturase [Sandarakinorhabdus sp.]|uniref:fatty acid desaturase n=1 Tax=Sandarakinorhabdus sp. TaxID=1916663 RepID=UPI00333E58A0